MTDRARGPVTGQERRCVYVDPMNMRNKIVALGILVVLCGTLLAFQGSRPRRWAAYEPEMEDPVGDPPDAWEKTEFAFCRLRYHSINTRLLGDPRGYPARSWGIDSNKAERSLSQGIRRLTRIDTRSVEEIVNIDSDALFDWPWLYAVEVGHWQLTDAEGNRLRQYLLRGGFLMVDDFHGTMEWQVFMAGIQHIFPDRPVVDIPGNDPIFHTVYDLDHRFQVPGAQFLYSGRIYEKDGYNAEWKGIYDDRGRLMVAICHNMDLGDAWEWSDDPRYPEKFASLAYRIGVNYVVYSMTH
jgi:Domain of unknown function (DUF4159)